jgi:hypothetical protein
MCYTFGVKCIMDEPTPPTNGPEAKQKTPPDPPAALTVFEKKSPENADTGKAKDEKDVPNNDLRISIKGHILSRAWLWIRRDTTSTDWLIVLLTAVIAGTSYLQWHEIRSGGQDTHDLAVAAGKQAEKMRDMSDAADKIRQAADNMVTQDQRIADNAQHALEASNRQSRAVLDETIAASRLDQRAWVAPLNISSTPKLEPGKDFIVQIIYKNTGKTPAKHSITRYWWEPVPKGAKPAYAMSKVPTISETLIAPNAEYGQTVKPFQEAFDAIDKTLTITADAKEKIKNQWSEQFTSGNVVLYVHGRIDYDDIFNCHHWTIYCSYLTFDHDVASMTVCPEHNDTDKGKCVVQERTPN